MKADLKSIRDRTIDEGDCWIWTQGVNSTGYPQATVGNQGGVMVRRLAFELGGKKLAKGRRWVIVSDCSRLCVNPDHLKQWKRGALMEKCYREGLRSTVAESARRRSQLIERNGSKLTMDIAREVRASAETTAELARRYKVSQSAIRRIRQGKSWKELAANASVFTYRPAA